MVTVLTAGHVNWDVTLRVDRLPAADGEAAIRSQHRSRGGSAANVATALAGLGVDAGLIGSVGDDDSGLLVRRELEAAGVDLDGLRVLEGAETAVKYLLVDDAGEVAVLGNDGVNEAVTPADVDPSRVGAADHVHLTSQRPDTAAAIARAASEAGATISFDPGRRIGDRGYEETLALADVVFATDREAESILESEYGDSAFADRIVAVTYGAGGAAVHTPNGSCEHAGFVVDAVDTAGSGDAFAAGFVASVLGAGLNDDTDGEPLTVELGDGTVDVRRALECANACGAFTAGREGIRDAPSSAELRAFLRSRR